MFANFTAKVLYFLDICMRTTKRRVAEYADNRKNGYLKGKSQGRNIQR